MVYEDDEIVESPKCDTCDKPLNIVDKECKHCGQIYIFVRTGNHFQLHRKSINDPIKGILGSGWGNNMVTTSYTGHSTGGAIRFSMLQSSSPIQNNSSTGNVTTYKKKITLFYRVKKCISKRKKK